MRLTSGGDLKILDFGIARWREPVSDVAKTLSLEPNETFAGTLPYMAPEQVRCEEVDARTDIWGAGTVLYELATGQRAPTQGLHATRCLGSILTVSGVSGKESCNED
jgi:serine/threonine-protein kinase